MSSLRGREIIARCLPACCKCERFRIGIGGAGQALGRGGGQCSAVAGFVALTDAVEPRRARALENSENFAMGNTWTPTFVLGWKSIPFIYEIEK